MFRKISRDVKIAAVRLYERNLLELDDILDCCGIASSNCGARLVMSSMLQRAFVAVLG
jgi:hypothetical protein